MHQLQGWYCPPAHPEQFVQTPSICLNALTEEFVNRVAKNSSLIR
jgi:hypothetical protein